MGHSCQRPDCPGNETCVNAGNSRKNVSSEQFNDEQLLNLARYHLYSTTNDVSSEDERKVKTLLSKEKLENAERNFLISFCASSKTCRVKSMRQMKAEILHMIGASESSNASNIVNVAELKSIHEWFCENFKHKN